MAGSPVMKSNKDIWLMVKKDKVVVVELRTSSNPAIRNKTIKSLRRAVSKHKDKDESYKLNNPRATISSDIIDYNESTNILRMQFVLFEPAKTVEEL